MIFYIISFALIIVLLIFFKVIDIRISFSKSQDRFLVNVVDDSYLSTLKAFISAEDYEYIAGKVIFFCAWNSFCRGSIDEIHVLDKVQTRYRDNKKIVFISYCRDPKPQFMAAFLKKMKLTMNFRHLTTHNEGLRSSLRTLLSKNPNLGHIDPMIDFSSLSFIIDTDEKVLYCHNVGQIKKELSLIYSILDKF